MSLIGFSLSSSKHIFCPYIHVDGEKVWTSQDVSDVPDQSKTKRFRLSPTLSIVVCEVTTQHGSLSHPVRSLISARRGLKSGDQNLSHFVLAGVSRYRRVVFYSQI